MNGVRPTKRALTDLGLGFPHLEEPLEELDHELIVKAQKLPDVHAAGGAKRITAIVDRVWFKLKVDDYRGVAGQFSALADTAPAMWWIGAAGHRKNDTPNQDFYSRLQNECEREAKKDRAHTAKTRSVHLGPQEIDRARYVAELAALTSVALRKIVREAICRSAHSGHQVSAATQNQRITAWVKSLDGETYLAIATDGFLDPKEIAIILDAVPGMNADEWMIEPGEVLGITPGRGELVFSAILPAESLAMLLEDSPGDYL